MKYSICLSFLLLSSLSARENPFFPLDESKKQKVTSNIPDARPQMGTVSYTFPDQSRVLKEVTLSVQNLDGSIEERKIQVDQTIDWHRPLVLSQGGKSAHTVAAKNSSVANFGFVQFYSKGKSLSVKAPDALVRHFVLSDPNRIVLDFKHAASFKSEKKALNAAPYLDVTLGNHGQFARATITLDGHYSYTLNKAGGLITITCK
ncbi:MAG: AMIN domain-containing protein [Sulfuricurvum sp.]|uniref:AMIN domain-containing protein n=1 Tax=Sulfuricurvum sp. TaxID=2025608 RepID=UPI00271E8936|nr:AMIN domain-containing protein [Sulfuricurvum sp.]MDO9056953.1 AMIN domain-containing protein [Sulfuricurvum sp.]